MSTHQEAIAGVTKMGKLIGVIGIAVVALIAAISLIAATKWLIAYAIAGIAFAVLVECSRRLRKLFI